MKYEIENLRRNVADKLKDLRYKKGISREELSEFTGLDDKTIFKYENAMISQSLDKLIILADFYNVNVTYFFDLNYENMYRYDFKSKKYV